MSDVPHTPAAILLITVWLDPGTAALRARIISTVDARAPGVSFTVSGREAVLASLDEWLDACETEQPS